MKDFRELKLVFMGTPEFAVASLSRLVEAGCTVLAVVTAPDKQSGRGMHLQESPVKQYALSKNLNLLQPVKLKDPAFIDSLKQLNADLFIVVAFRMLPEIVWNMPPMGTVNIHGSLLPKYRGAAPINWAIMNGETETGVTSFKLQQEIDTGDLLCSKKIIITPDETAGTLHDKMKEIGADLLLETIQSMVEGTLHPVPQSIPTDANGTLQTLPEAPKIFTETCNIDWNHSAVKVFNQIRGLSPYPAAFTFLEEKKLKIFNGKIINEVPTIKPGAFITDGKTYLRFACANGFIELLEVQLEGKKRMDTVSFLRGYRFK